MRARYLWAAVCILIVASPPLVQSNSSPTLEERLAALERRVEQLELENRGLKDQIARVLPVAASSGVEVASVSAASTVASAAQHPAPSLSPASTLRSSPLPSQPQAQATPEKAKSERVEIGGQLRFRAEVRQNGDLDSRSADVQDFVGQRLRFHVRAKLSDQVDTFLQFQDSRLWGQEVSPLSNDNLTDLHQGYIHVHDFLRRGFSLRAGRQELNYGSERLIGRANWDNVGRSFDAVTMGYASKSWAADWFTAKVVDRRQTGRGDRDQYLYALYSQLFRTRRQHLDLYGILFRDGLRTASEIAGLSDRRATQIMTVGFRSDGRLQAGLNYELELAQQFGHHGPDSHRARALAAKLYKTLEETHKVRIGFEYDVATGDRNPNDGRSSEFFNLFPTNHTYYGYADLMGWRNMQDFRPMFTLAPAASLRFDLDYHRFYLLSARGPWKDAGGKVLGFDPGGRSGTHVGDELDFTMAFPLHKHLQILSGYSLFLPGQFARNTRGQDMQHFVYLQTLVDF